MQKNNNKGMILKDDKGMTLVEIMIVLAIIASITGVLVTQISSRLKKANINKAKAQITEIMKSLDMYYTDCYSFPSSDQGLAALVEAPDNCSDWGPDPYLKRVPKDPWGTDLIYEEEGGNVVIISLGADRAEGGDGEAKDISSEDL